MHSLSPAIARESDGPKPASWSLSIPGLALFLLTAAAFSSTLSNGWTGWDDTAYVLNSPLMKVPGGLARIWTTGETEQFYPLTFTSYWLQYRWFGGEAGGYHAVNVILHSLNAVLCLAFLRALGLGRFGAILGAALFALHPTQAITVAWIAEHKNTLCGTFTFLTLLAWVKSRSGSRHAAWYIVSLACFALAMLSKTVVLALPFALLLLDHTVLRVTWKRGIARVVPMLLIAVALGGLTFFFEQKFVDKASPQWMPGLLERIQIAGAAPWAYLWHLLWPWKLSIAYPLWDAGASHLHWWLPALASLTAAIALIHLHRHGRIRALWVWGFANFFLILGPTLGIIPFGNLVVTHVSDHFLYLASMGLFIPFAAEIERWRDASESRRLPAMGLVGLIVVVCAAVSFRDGNVYQDAVTMWSRAVEVAPDNYTVRLGLAEGLAKRGRRDQALPHYRKAVELRPNWPDAWLFLGQNALDQRDYDSAERAFRKVLDLSPADGTALLGLANTLEQSGHIDEALATFEAVVQRYPDFVEARSGLAKMYLGFARYQDALAQFQAVVRLRPDQPMPHVGVATCLRKLNRDADALAGLRQARDSLPGDVAILNMLARILATSPDDLVRNGAQALAAATRAAELTQHANPLVLDTLAAALAESGKPADAANASRAAAALHRKLGSEPAALRSDDLAALYAQGQTLRE
ncbi:hypothetical protein PHYC_04005 [Phycisphaerales bacterium]|nr:hypothetical protein PHYC_04005 [Phycisphaerales bacterium]